MALFRSKVFQSIIGLAISAAFIAWLVVSIDWTHVGSALTSVHYFYLLPATGIFILQYVLRSLRWKYLLPPGRQVLISRLFDSIMVGSLATNVLPLRAGEFVRPFMLARVTGLSFSSSFVSVVIERFFDLSMVLLSFAILVPRVNGIPAWAHDGAIALTGIAGALLAFIILGALAPKPLLRVSDFVTSFLPKKIVPGTQKFLRDFLDGAGVLKDPVNLIRVCGLSVIVWITTYSMFYCFLFLFDVDPSWWLAVTVTVIISLAVAAPSAPGFVGVYQVACVAAFALFGMSKEIAVAYSIISHLFQYLACVGYGTFVLFWRNLSLRELQKQEA